MHHPVPSERSYLPSWHLRSRLLRCRVDRGIWMGVSLALGVVPLRVPTRAILRVTMKAHVQRARLYVHPAQAFAHVPRGSAHAVRAPPPPDPFCSHLRRPITISDRHTSSFSLSTLGCFLRGLPLGPLSPTQYRPGHAG